MERRKFIRSVVVYAAGLALASSVPCKILAQSCPTITDRVFGEPIQLNSQNGFMFFTSWKYVRQGQVDWKIVSTAGKPDAILNVIDKPTNVRLVAQQPTHRHKVADDVFGWSSVYSDGEYRVYINRDNNVLQRSSPNGFTNWSAPQYSFTTSDNVHGVGPATVFIDPTPEAAAAGERYKMIYTGSPTADEWEAYNNLYPGERDTMTWRSDHNPPDEPSRVALYGAVSPNGLPGSWRRLNFPLMMQHADSVNTAYYDVDLKKYVVYVRTWQVDDLAPGALNPCVFDTTIGGNGQDFLQYGSTGRRSIGRSYSTDFQHFGRPTIVTSTDANSNPSYVWYNNAKTTLPECDDNHVMFPIRWEQDTDTMQVCLFSSPDGTTWSQVPTWSTSTGMLGPEPIMPRHIFNTPSASGCSPTGAQVQAHGSLLEYSDIPAVGSDPSLDGVWWGIKYYGRPYPHKYPDGLRYDGENQDPINRPYCSGVPNEIGVALWPKGRLVALQPDNEAAVATFATVGLRPLTDPLKWARMRVNARVRNGGYIKVALRRIGEEGNISGHSFQDSDQIGPGDYNPAGTTGPVEVSWKGGDTKLYHGNQPFVLRFELFKADLFGIKFENND